MGKTILAISSFVVSETVGLSANRFALERLGHEVLALPTITLSGIPDCPPVVGVPSDCNRLGAMVDALDANGHLQRVDGVLTGYLPTEGHVHVAAEMILRVRKENPSVLVLCDPILGDQHKGLYIEEAAACGVREHLVPLADILTPNAFELSWLTGCSLNSISDATQAMSQFGASLVLTTSFEMDRKDRLSNILKFRDNFFDYSVPRLEKVPHGTGDFLAALFLGDLLNGRSAENAGGYCVAATRIAIEALRDSDRFDVVSTQERWASAEPLAGRVIEI